MPDISVVRSIQLLAWSAACGDVSLASDPTSIHNAFTKVSQLCSNCHYYGMVTQKSVHVVCVLLLNVKVKYVVSFCVLCLRFLLIFDVGTLVFWNIQAGPLCAYNAESTVAELQVTCQKCTLTRGNCRS